MPFRKQHALAKEPLRSAILARALRDVSIITQRGPAALLLAAEPRTAALLPPSGLAALPAGCERSVKIK